MKVRSSHISEIDHTNNVLRVRFSDGSVYEYKDVPHQTFRALGQAKSVGTYFETKIKGRFKFKRVV